MTHTPIIVDCDNAMGVPGCDVDDGLALLFLLAQPAVALRGVTTCFGNAPLPLVLGATRRLLRHTAVPVLAGASRPGAAPSGAASFLVEATRRERGRIIVLALGPLTNLAAAADLDQSFPGNCKAIICLGGTLGPAPKLGWRRLRELNFAADPAAVAWLLATTDCPVTVVPTTSCLELRLAGADIAQVSPRLRRHLWCWLACMRFGRGIGHFVAWDLVAALALTHPALLTRRRASVTLGARGEMVMAAGMQHEVVTGLADDGASRKEVLRGLGPAFAAALPR